jgi:hypothetical protein
MLQMSRTASPVERLRTAKRVRRTSAASLATGPMEALVGDGMIGGGVEVMVGEVGPVVGHGGREDGVAVVGRWQRYGEWCAVWWRTMVCVVVGWWVRVCSWWRSRAPGPAVVRQLDIRDCLLLAAAGVPAEDAAAVVTIGGDVAQRLAALRATRAARTCNQARSTLLQFVAFLECNQELSVVRSEDTFDILMDAFLVAKVNPPGGLASLQRPLLWGPCVPRTAGKQVGGGMAALERLGYVQGVWPRTSAQRVALGCNDDDDAVPTEPIFAWEVCSAARRLEFSPTLSPWDRCAMALVSLGSVGGRRVSMCTALLRSAVLRTTRRDQVVVQMRARMKQQRARGVARPRRRVAGIVLQHWLIERWVVPWMEWLDSLGLPPRSTRLFPSMVRTRHARTRTSYGREVGDLWLEPTVVWDSRKVGAALDLVLANTRDGRRFHGLRGGNNIELRRLRDKVADVTRRSLHVRSVKDLIGSEDAYFEVFAEDYAAATVLLGSNRIQRSAAGLLSVLATSTSSGEFDDWVAVRGRAMAIAADDAVCDDSSEAGSADSEVSYDCGRCSHRVARDDHGFTCGHDDCKWGVCIDCLRGSPGAPLRCPAHT